MIIDLLISTVGMILKGIFQFFPIVTLADVPVIGDTIRSLLLTVVKTWNSFLVTFPYSEVVWNIFLFVILPFEGLMIFLKFLLGSRAIGKHE